MVVSPSCMVREHGGHAEHGRWLRLLARFAVGDEGSKQNAGRKQPPARKKKMPRKAKVNQLKWYRLKAKNKMKSPNPEVRIRYKLEKALEKYRYEQSLEHTSQFIEKMEKELEDYQKHVALFKKREGAISEKISNKDTTVGDLTTSSDTE